MGVAQSNGTQENPSIMEQAGKPILDGTISHIVSGCITIIKSSQELTVNSHLSFSTPPSTINSQQSTVNSQQSFEFFHPSFYNQQSTVNRQQSTVNNHLSFSTPPSTVNSQQSTIPDGVTGTDIRYNQFYSRSIAHHLQ